MTDITKLGDTPLKRLQNLMQILRSSDGCPWDKAQSFETIAPYTIEEAYEVKDAIDRGDMAALKEELGDLLFQVIFHSQMADEVGAFCLTDVADGLCIKMVNRHPHVFGGADERTAEAQTQAWEDMKARERQDKSPGQASVLDGVAKALPALMRAEKLQKRAARVGFDWPDDEGALDKVCEEAREVAQAAALGDKAALTDEIGDLLFAVTNIARRHGVDPEAALRSTNDKFTRRFQYIEQKAHEKGLNLSDMSLNDMDKLWDAAKRAE